MTQAAWLATMLLPSHGDISKSELITFPATAFNVIYLLDIHMHTEFQLYHSHPYYILLCKPIKSIICLLGH